MLAPDDPARMFDRIQMHQGLPQRYGTQTFTDNANRNWIWPVSSVDSLEQRRAEVGLPPMDAYLQLAKDSTGVEIIWNPNLGLEEAKKLKS